MNNLKYLKNENQKENNYAQHRVKNIAYFS
jgi:hypothetical protein